MRKYTNTYYENHKNDTVKAYLGRTKERRLAYGKEYYQEHREERQEYQRKYNKKRRNPKDYFKDTLLELLNK